MTEQHRIASLSLDDSTVSPSAAHLEHERRVAMADILQENFFRPIGEVQGPYDLRLGIQESRLAIEVRDLECRRLGLILLSLTPLRRVMRDYLAVCDSYYEALKAASPSRVEAIDVGRRALHNEGSEVLRERLDGKIEIDHETARRLFTLICALRARG
ncbi:MAG: UPF0262 family protein [Alphaproteobacteria bacterium]|jgi:uncharacterized protein (UPF0262 family)|nr:UPF0262 family protein [Alphaproteobacteria bacterium]